MQQIRTAPDISENMMLFARTLDAVYDIKGLNGIKDISDHIKAGGKVINEPLRGQMSRKAVKAALMERDIPFASVGRDMIVIEDRDSDRYRDAVMDVLAEKERFCQVTDRDSMENIIAGNRKINDKSVCELKGLSPYEASYIKERAPSVSKGLIIGEHEQDGRVNLIVQGAKAAELCPVYAGASMALCGDRSYVAADAIDRREEAERIAISPALDETWLINPDDPSKCIHIHKDGSAAKADLVERVPEKTADGNTDRNRNTAVMASVRSDDPVYAQTVLSMINGLGNVKTVHDMKDLPDRYPDREHMHEKYAAAKKAAGEKAFLKQADRVIKETAFKDDEKLSPSLYFDRYRRSLKQITAVIDGRWNRREVSLGNFREEDISALSETASKYALDMSEFEFPLQRLEAMEMTEREAVFREKEAVTEKDGEKELPAAETNVRSKAQEFIAQNPARTADYERGEK